jgi:cytochrome c-type biogenesis protein CcmF
MLLLTGIGPLLAWRKSTLTNLRDSFLFPAGVGIVGAATVVALGVPLWASGLCFALSGFVFGTISQEFWRGARVRQRATGTDLFTALVGLVGRNKRRYGGYIVHLGIMLLFLGFAGEGFKQSEQALLKPGQQLQVGDFVTRYDQMRITDDGRKQMVTAQVTVMRDGEPFATMYPAKWYFRKHEEQPTTEVAIRRGFAQDVYVVLAGYDAGGQTASIDVTIAPLVNWIWFGFGILALGTFIALLPDTVFAFATVNIPQNAVTTSMVLLAIVIAPGVAFGQTTGAVAERTALERSLENEIMCTCGCRLPNGTCGMMNCHGKEAQTGKLRKLIAEGKTREEIIATFVNDFGSEDVLSRPINRGFNRLIWLAPYLIAVAALAGIFVAARRWARPHTPAFAGDAGIDATLNARLDDELRNFD